MTILFPDFPVCTVSASAEDVDGLSKEDRKRLKKHGALRFILDDDALGLQNFIESSTRDLFSSEDIYRCLEKAIEFRAKKSVAFLLTKNPAVESLSSFCTLCAREGYKDAILYAANLAHASQVNIDWQGVIFSAAKSKRVDILQEIFFGQFTGRPQFSISNTHFAPLSPNYSKSSTYSSKYILSFNALSKTMMGFLDQKIKARNLLSLCPKDTIRSSFLDHFLKQDFVPTATYKDLLDLEALCKESPEIKSATNRFLSVHGHIKTKVRGVVFSYTCATFAECVLMRSSNLLKEIVLSGQAQSLKSFSKKDNFWPCVLSNSQIMPSGLSLCKILGEENFKDQHGNSPGHLAMSASPGRATVELMEKLHKDWLFMVNSAGLMLSDLTTNDQTKMYIEKHILTSGSQMPHHQDAPRRRI